MLAAELIRDLPRQPPPLFLADGCKLEPGPRASQLALDPPLVLVEEPLRRSVGRAAWKDDLDSAVVVDDDMGAPRARRNANLGLDTSSSRPSVGRRSLRRRLRRRPSGRAGFARAPVENDQSMRPPLAITGERR
jgi:hypothetical protein